MKIEEKKIWTNEIYRKENRGKDECGSIIWLICFDK